MGSPLRSQGKQERYHICVVTAPATDKCRIPQSRGPGICRCIQLHCYTVSEIHIYAALQEITVHKVPVGEAAFVRSDTVRTVGTDGLIESVVGYGMLRLDGIHLTMQSVLRSFKNSFRAEWYLFWYLFCS